jgi:hypothetical protein
MTSVSSNAVANVLSYSTTEQSTGGKWIDGKPIYRKVLEMTSPSAAGGSVLTNLTSLNINSLIDLNCMIYANDFVAFKSSYVWQSDNIILFYRDNSGELWWYRSGADWAANTYLRVELTYTKTS